MLSKAAISAHSQRYLCDLVSQKLKHRSVTVVTSQFTRSIMRELALRFQCSFAYKIFCCGWLLVQRVVDRIRSEVKPLWCDTASVAHRLHACMHTFIESLTDHKRHKVTCAHFQWSQILCMRIYCNNPGSGSTTLTEPAVNEQCRG